MKTNNLNNSSLMSYMITKARTQKGLTQKDLARLIAKNAKVSCSASAVSAWEDNRKSPLPVRREAIEKILGLPDGYLIEADTIIIKDEYHRNLKLGPAQIIKSKGSFQVKMLNESMREFDGIYKLSEENSDFIVGITDEGKCKAMLHLSRINKDYECYALS